MAVQTIIYCDVCHERVPSAERSTLRFGREPKRRPAVDLCAACVERLDTALGRPVATADQPLLPCVAN